MSSFQERFHETMVKAFEGRAQGYNENTDLYTLGDASQVDDLFDYLEFEFSGDIDDNQRQHFRYVTHVWTWAWAAYEKEQEEETNEAEEAAANENFSNASEFAWRDRILPIQRLLLQLFYYGGLAAFGYGMYVTIKLKSPQTGGMITGLGMFVAVQMNWGMQSFYAWLQKRNSKLLRSPGYPTLFWIAVSVVLIFDVVIAGLAQEYLMSYVMKFLK